MTRNCLWAFLVLRVFFTPGNLFTENKWLFAGTDTETGKRMDGETIFPILEGDKLDLKCDPNSNYHDRDTCWYVRHE